MDIETSVKPKRFKRKHSRILKTFGSEIHNMVPAVGLLMELKKEDQKATTVFLKREYGDARKYITLRLNSKVYLLRIK